MTDLPSGWAETTIDGIAAPVERPITDGPFGSNLKTSHYTSSGPRVIRLQNIGDSRFIDEYAHISRQHYMSLRAHAVEAGDLVIASLGTDLPRACLVPPHVPPAIVKADCIRVRVHPQVNARYLNFALNSQTMRRLAAAQVHGVGRPRLGLKGLRTLRLPLPPAAEQGRIVEAIEEEFSRLDAADTSLGKVRTRATYLRTSNLQAAFANVDADRWRIGQFATVGSGATPKRGRSDYYEDGTVPWVTSGQLTNRFVREPTALITEKALAETAVKIWPAGTLLVAMYGEGRTRGHCSELTFPSTANQACAAIHLTDDSPVLRDYLRLYFAASYEQNRRLASGGVQPNLSLGLIKSMEVPVPPVDQQRRIVAEVERQLSLVESMEAAVKRALARSAQLRRAVLERAFSGRLVPQDPTDEPASALLARIAADHVGSRKSWSDQENLPQSCSRG